MRYNPSKKAEEGGGRAQPGTYPFKVEEAQEVTFKTGAEGLSVKLLVGAFHNRDITVFARFTYGESAQWKLKQFMDAIGVDFYRPPQNAYELERHTGKAKFKLGDNGYLEVDEFIAASANNGPDSRHDYGPPPMDDEPPPPMDPDQPPF